MYDVDFKANCPYKNDIICDAAVNLLCDNLCKHHPRYVEGGSNMNFQTHRCPYSDGTTCSGDDCKSDCFFHPDYMDYVERTRTPEERKAGLTYDDGYEKGKEDMAIEMSANLEDAYLDGFKACWRGEEPMIEDSELRELRFENMAYSKGCRVNNDSSKVVNGDLNVSGKLLCMIEDVKERLNRLHSQVLTSGITGEKEQRYGATEILCIIDILNRVQQEYVSDALYEYLGCEK